MANGIADILARFREIRGVSMAALVGSDGLVIESSHNEDVDADGIAAVASNALMLSEAIGRQLERGGALQTLLEYENGLVVIEPLSDEALILIVSDDRLDLGRIRFTTRQQKARLLDALAALS